MINPENNIQSLLYDNDCVIIPDFGGFIRRENPTVLDKFSNTIKPKGSTLFFNAVLQQNDGLLANHIADEKSVSYQEALELLSQWVKETEKEITLNGKFKLGSLGTFFVNAEGKKWFSPTPSLNFSKNTFGLETIIAKAIISDIEQINEKEQIQKERFEEQLANSPLKFEKTKKSRLTLKIAASLILLLGVGSVLYFTVLENGRFNVFQQAQIIPLSDTPPVVREKISINPETIETQQYADTFGTNNEAIDSSENLLQEQNDEINSDIIVPEPDVRNTVQLETNDVDEKIGEEGIYTILAGAFLHADNAQRRVRFLRENGLDVYPVKPDNSRLTRIQCGRFSSQEEAEVHLLEVQKIIPQAHITSFK
ncbi:MAG: SPOR domain-containing protein [Bacteroidetes bacterium]|nr:SPOR domain-containing protein [Bacteroidota bacterium]